jgi:tetratricopeptide (TPR) repeat protein
MIFSKNKSAFFSWLVTPPQGFGFGDSPLFNAIVFICFILLSIKAIWSGKIEFYGVYQSGQVSYTLGLGFLFIFGAWIGFKGWRQWRTYARQIQAAEAEALQGHLMLIQSHYAKASVHFHRAAYLLPKGYEETMGIYLNNAGYSDYLVAQTFQAELFYQQAQAIFENLWGQEHPYVATTLNNLALLYKSQGHYSSAKTLYERTLTVRKKLLGDDHLDVATSLNNLAVWYYEQGDYPQAKILLEKTVTIYKKILGRDYADIAITLNNFGGLYYAQGRYAQAESLFERALTIYEKALGPHHPDIVVSLNNLAQLYQAQGRYQLAKPLYERALTILNKVFGFHHPLWYQINKNYEGLLGRVII